MKLTYWVYHHHQTSEKVLDLSFAWFFLGFFPKKYLIYKLRGFLLNILRIFRFSSSIPHWLRRFFLNQFCIFLIVFLWLWAWYSKIWFFFLIFLFNRLESFSPISQNKYQTMLINYIFNRTCAYKKDNFNDVAMWPYHVIWYVITSNNIWLNLLIALTYHLVPDGSLF